MQKSDPQLVVANIEKLIETCQEHIDDLNRYMKKEPDTVGLLDGKTREIIELRDKWQGALDHVKESGMDEVGEYSYPTLSYDASYAFVILAKILKEVRFWLEKMDLYDDYMSCCS